ncbi:MAG: hypothetical protein HOP12_13710 [Candidatus Eisenbacteria bacterium]|uniref:DUF5683 domain-containing protein n=1 Tax=Eiseniibacteriota bacterium TaxID=2212470 RepID=A0A849SHJ4_UNCEI|nr:hypothetical protein [Candidatus Eisenbacteria bacterium]
MRWLRAGITLLALVSIFDRAAGADAPAAVPFPVVALDSAPARPNGWAYASLLGGAALIGSSFYFTGRANSHYDDYLRETDPARIESLYDTTLRNDAYARSSLIAGEALIATGLYLRFIHRPHSGARLQWSIAPTRCAIAFRF